ncbi:MAG: hypothetical protein ACI30N_08655 [Muribaculaceae bacterium]
MNRLHYFYPENDGALAADTPGYTASKAAVTLRRCGSALPLWTGLSGDRFVDTGTNKAWLEAISEAFGRDVRPFDASCDGLQPFPWGWSKPVRREFLEMGMSPGLLPDDMQLARMRELSHRCTALRLAKELSKNCPDILPAGIEAFTVRDAMEEVRIYGRAMVKLPWSSSGRGVTDSDTIAAAEIERKIVGTIRRQGSVIVQPFVENAVDFGLLYEMQGGVARYLGLSVFDHDRHFTYTGSVVASEALLRDELAHRGVAFRVDVAESTGWLLTEIIGNDYEGIVGVDMLGCPGSRAVAVGEINLRQTMGYVALRLAANVLAPGKKGRFAIGPSDDTPWTPSAPTDEQIFGDAIVKDNRLCGGTLRLNAPDLPVAFTLSVE